MRAQKGISLIMALIFLMVLALLGTWAATSSALQERMAGSTRNHDLAFQAAEAALKDAENTLTTWRTGTFDGTAGLFLYPDPIPPGDPIPPNDLKYWRDAAQWTSVRTVPSGNLGHVATMPVYVIHKLPNTANPDSVPPNQLNIENYRVTARGVGGDASAVSILQAIYSYTP